MVVPYHIRNAGREPVCEDVAELKVALPEFVHPILGDQGALERIKLLAIVQRAVGYPCRDLPSVRDVRGEAEGIGPVLQDLALCAGLEIPGGLKRGARLGSDLEAQVAG